MSIRDAILALSPNLYWPLNDGSGTVAHNEGSLSNNGTISGPVDFAAPGPESGTTALRLFNLGQCVSLAMDLAAPSNVSLCCWFTTPGDQAGGVASPIVTIGDPANRFARGPVIYQQPVSTVATVFGRWSGTVTSNTPFGGDPNNWHFVLLTLQTGTNGQKIYRDGAGAVQSTMTSPVNCLNTDPLLLRSTANIIIAHVGFWNRVLGPSEIDGIWAQKAIWPYIPPVASAPGTGSGGGGGGLTTDQAAQLSEIDTKTDALPTMQTGINTLLSNWAGYTGVTLPSLQDALDHISGQVTDVQSTLNDFATGVLNYIQTTLTDVWNAVQVHIPGPAGAVADAIGHLFSPTSVDQIGLYDILGGPTCENIDLDLSLKSYYGLQLTITTRPMHFWSSTPDNDWTIGDLAVVSIIVSGTLLQRIPVHNSSLQLNGLPGGFPFKVADIGIPILPNGYHLKVEWAPGVCGKLELQYLPAVGPPGFPHFP